MTDRLTRIDILNQTTSDTLWVMSEGNPGACAAMVELIQFAPVCDPDSVWEGLGPLLALDELGIYGPRIYMLWSDVCHRDAVSMIAVLRAWQLGLTTSGAIAHAIDNQGEGLDLGVVMEAVKAKLPHFNKGA